MAQVDIAGLLTGIPALQSPRMQGRINAANLPSGTPLPSLAGALEEGRTVNQAGMRRALGGLLGRDLRTEGEKAREAVGQATSNLELAQAIQGVAPEQAVALRRLAAQEQAAREQEKKTLSVTASQKKSLAKYLDETYPELGLGDLARNGTITPQNLKTFLPLVQKNPERFIPLNGNIFDTQEQIFLTGPSNGKEDLITVDGRLYSVSAGTFITTKDPKEPQKTNSIIEYEYVAKTNKASGIPTPSFEDYQKGTMTSQQKSPQKTIYEELRSDAIANGKEFSSFNEWYDANNNVKTDTIEILDETTGNTLSYLINSKTGKRIANLGIVKAPNIEIITNPDSTFSVYNTVTGNMGAPVETPEAAAQKKDKFYKTMGLIASVDNTLGILSEAKALKEGGVGGIEYSIFKFLPETAARELDSKITTVQAALSFDKLQEMRNNSPTGGALGQVSNLELELLKSAVSALDGALGVEAFNKQVQLIQEHYNRFKRSLLGQADYRIVDNQVFIRDPNGDIYSAGDL